MDYYYYYNIIYNARQTSSLLCVGLHKINKNDEFLRTWKTRESLKSFHFFYSFPLTVLVKYYLEVK